tara:strand:+ start:439 stop:957 length:519 start_codon:yes stop_codon:yes gene_type:complete
MKKTKKKKKTYKKKRTYKKKSYKKGGARLQYPKVYDNLEKSIKELTKLNGNIDMSKIRSLKIIQKKLVDKKPEEIRPELEDLIKKLNIDILKNSEIFDSNIFINLLHSLKELNRLNNLQKEKIKEFETSRKELIKQIIENAIKDKISELPKDVKESEFYESTEKLREILKPK